MAVRRVLERAAQEIQASRVDLLSADAGPVTSAADRRVPASPHVSARACSTRGSSIGPETHGRRTRAWRAGPPGLAAARGGRGAMAARPDARPRRDQRCWSSPPRSWRRGSTRCSPAARVAAAAAASVPELVGVSRAMDEVRRAIVRAAARRSRADRRRERMRARNWWRAPFISSARGANAGSATSTARRIPDELLESELFGHARGAFTGAVADRPGLFEDANGGTLFLDEVADLSPRGQAKLLRVLQQQEVRRVGETFSRTVDVRLVTAANRDMRTEASAGRFRQDLLYRLDVIRIHVPPLRERPEDIALLAEHFWRDGGGARRVGGAADPRRVDRADPLSLAGQRARAAERDRGARGGGAVARPGAAGAAAGGRSPAPRASPRCGSTRRGRSSSGAASRSRWHGRAGTAASRRPARAVASGTAEDDREAGNRDELTAFLPAFRLSGQSLIGPERPGGI